MRINKKAIAGRLGGIKTVKTHGKEHMRKIGLKGADSTWSKYKIVPAGNSGYAMVERLTDKVIAVW